MVAGITNIEGIESFTKKIILHYMDRSNGGDNLAPPRPPKLLPRVHRPRAPEPVIMSETTTVVAPLSTITATAAAAVTSTLRTPQCTSTTTQQLIRNNNNKNNSRSSNNSNNNNQQTHQNSIKNTSTDTAAAATAATRTLPVNTNTNNIHIQPNIISNINSKNNNNIEVSTLLSTSPPSSSIALQSEDYQIHHLTFLPQRATPNLNRNGSHVSTSSSSASTSLITATNSFTRRRPQSPLIGVAPSAQPVVTTITGNSSSSSSTNNSNSNNNNNNNNNFLSHFHSVDPVPISPVTLAQPRPESERLVNEYVDTPLRNAHQLQHASRVQHPAGQHDNGQTTTHHFLLLPQRELRQQQQQQQNQQQQHIYPSNRLAATAGSVNATTGIDGTDGFLHSHNQQHQHNPSHNKMSAHTPSTGLGTASAKVTTNFHTSPITQPITKQPATSINQSTCKFAKELPALDELLDFHNIATGITTAQGMVSAVSGASPLGPPIIFGSGSEGPSSLSPITCPRCERCRCEQCQSPRPLPQTWICNKTCLCSAESIIDYASCLCCAKALFYHCARDNDMDCDDGSSTPCVDNPCSCGPYKRTQRWGWLGALSLVLPCLWCYWPMRGCTSLCEKCYGRFAKRGCRCQQIGSTSSMLPIASPHTVNGNNVMVMGGASTIHANSNVTSKSVTHHSHHNDCTNAANRILRKGDPTPEKRLLDTSPEY